MRRSYQKIRFRLLWHSWEVSSETDLFDAFRKGRKRALKGGEVPGKKGLKPDGTGVLRGLRQTLGRLGIAVIFPCAFEKDVVDQRFLMPMHEFPHRRICGEIDQFVRIFPKAEK